MFVGADPISRLHRCGNDWSEFPISITLLRRHMLDHRGCEISKDLTISTELNS